MKLSELTINTLTGNRKWKNRIAKEIGVEYFTIGKYIRQNRPHNVLTTVAVVNLITELTGLTQDQILTDEKLAA
jgi:hypothetical protein